jgi:hypothetical protein
MTYLTATLFGIGLDFECVPSAVPPGFTRTPYDYDECVVWSSLSFQETTDDFLRRYLQEMRGIEVPTLDQMDALELEIESLDDPEEALDIHGFVHKVGVEAWQDVAY